MTVTLTWQPETFRAKVGIAADVALAYAAATAVRVMNATGPVETGALTASEKAAPVGYDADESAQYVPRRGGSPAHELQTPEMIADLIEDHAVWIGSWIFYALPVENGWEQITADGRSFGHAPQPHIAPAGMAVMGEAQFLPLLRRAWAEVMRP